RVDDQRTIVQRIDDAVVVTIQWRVTGIADAIAIAVGLIGIGDQRAVIDCIGNAVAITIRIAGIAVTIAILVFLTGIGHRRAIVLRIQYTIAVEIGIADV